MKRKLLSIVLAMLMLIPFFSINVKASRWRFGNEYSEEQLNEYINIPDPVLKDVILYNIEYKELTDKSKKDDNEITRREALSMLTLEFDGYCRYKYSDDNCPIDIQDWTGLDELLNIEKLSLTGDLTVTNLNFSDIRKAMNLKLISIKNTNEENIVKKEIILPISMTKYLQVMSLTSYDNFARTLDLAISSITNPDSSDEDVEVYISRLKNYLDNSWKLTISQTDTSYINILLVTGAWEDGSLFDNIRSNYIVNTGTIITRYGDELISDISQIENNPFIRGANNVDYSTIITKPNSKTFKSPIKTKYDNEDYLILQDLDSIEDCENKNRCGVSISNGNITIDDIGNRFKLLLYTYIVSSDTEDGIYNIAPEDKIDIEAAAHIQPWYGYTWEDIVDDYMNTLDSPSIIRHKATQIEGYIIVDTSEITDDASKFKPEIKDIEIKQGEDINIKDGIRNLPDDVEVEDKTDYTSVDNTKIGEYTGKLKLIFKDGSTKEVDVPIKVLDPKSPQDHEIDKLNKEIKDLKEELEKEKNKPQDDKNLKNIEDLLNQIKKLEDLVKAKQYELDKERDSSRNRLSDFSGLYNRDISNLEYTIKKLKKENKDNEDEIDNLKLALKNNTKTKIIDRTQDLSYFTKFNLNSYQYETYANGELISRAEMRDSKSEITPYIVNQRTMLPIRYVALALGLDVQYDNNTKIAKFTNYNNPVLNPGAVTIDTKNMTVYNNNGLPVTLDAPVELKNGRLYVSITNIARLFGATNGGHK